jgi:hypothetical protein
VRTEKDLEVIESVVFSVYVLPLKIESINPEVTVFGEVVSGRTLELRTSAGGKLVQMSENFRKGGAGFRR